MKISVYGQQLSQPYKICEISEEKFEENVEESKQLIKQATRKSTASN